MLGIGTGELMILMAVVLIVFGPKRIPELARYLGKATKMFQEASRELQRQLEMSEWDKEIKKDKSKSKTESTTSYDDDTSPYDETFDESTSPYDDDGTEDYDHYDDPYGYEDPYTSGDDESVDEQPEEAEVVANSPEATEPEKVEDAQRASRELNE